jgi:hypothetical protein
MGIQGIVIYLYIIDILHCTIVKNNGDLGSKEGVFDQKIEFGNLPPPRRKSSDKS